MSICASREVPETGGRIPRACCWWDLTGTGKTLLARAVAWRGERAVLLHLRSDFVEMFVGVGASRVRDLFEQGKKNAPCIIFIDEIDAVGRHPAQAWAATRRARTDLEPVAG